MLQLRNNRQPTQYFAKLRGTIDLYKQKRPELSRMMDKVWRMISYQFESPKPIAQCLEQLSQVVSDNHNKFKLRILRSKTTNNLGLDAA